MSRLVSSFDPDRDERRNGLSFADAVEAGAIAIYATIIRERDPAVAAEKWATKSREPNREDRRAEAEAVLRAIGWRS